MTTDENPFRLVTKEEAAELMSVSVRTLDRLIAEGKVPIWKSDPDKRGSMVRVMWWAFIQNASRDCGIEVQLSPVVRLESLRH